MTFLDQLPKTSNSEEWQATFFDRQEDKLYRRLLGKHEDISGALAVAIQIVQHSEGWTPHKGGWIPDTNFDRFEIMSIEQTGYAGSSQTAKR